MISECLEQHRSFGVVRSKEEGFADIGCTAEIVSVAKRYDDGRMDIVTEGRQRFEVMRVNQERSFLQAEVAHLDDDADAATSEEVAKALKLRDEIMTLAGGGAETTAKIDQRLLSFHLASSLPLDLDFKQTLLAMKSESERLRTIISFFEAILPQMRRTVHVRRKAGGNGHGG